MNKDTENSPATEPSVYIDQSVLMPQNGLRFQKTKGQLYTINESTFYDEDKPTDDYKEFQMYATRLSNVSVNLITNDKYESQGTYCSTPESDLVEVELLNDDAKLKVALTQVPNGYIINCNVYLTVQQWHTITWVDSVLLRCTVCEMYTDMASCDLHVSSDVHRNLLDQSRPLARFDLSVTRKIRDKYHCAVCNEAFDCDDEIEHFSSKSHEQNLLFAVNKVSDLDISSVNNGAGNKNNDSYHFNANAINNNNKKYGNGNNEDHFFANRFTDVNRFNDLYESSVGSYDDDYDGASNDCDEFESIWGDFGQRNEKSEFSYASMAKKPKIMDLPMYLEKDLGNKKVKVRFDSYHMLINLKSNKIYCMICKEYYRLRNKGEHCMEIDHLGKLGQLRVVDAYGDYFIREMDDKLYHCGHCNNLVLISDMEDHLEERHAKKPRNTLNGTKKLANCPKNINNDNDDARSSVTDGSEAAKNGCNDHMNNESNGNRINDKAVTKNTNFSYNINNNDMPISNVKPENNNNDIIRDNSLINNRPTSLSDLVFLNQFGYKLAIPLLSFNVVLKRQNYDDYYCGLCDIVCKEEAIISHIYYIPHIQTLQRIPFVIPFSINLIRAIRENFHCAICNIPISVQAIYYHVQESTHIELMTKALSVNQGAPSGNNTPNTLHNIVPNPIPNQPIPPVKSMPNKRENNGQNPVNDTTNKGNGKCGTEMKLTIKETAVTKDADEMDLMINDSVESVEFDLEEYVFVKFKNSYFKISLASYNTLVHIGDGSRYCFVCSSRVGEEELGRHVDSRSHLENVKNSKFLDKFKGNLLRQLFLMYHCGVCNVLVSRRELKNHLSWPAHLEEATTTLSVPKKSRKNDIKSGKAIHVAELTKEAIYLNEKESNIKVLFKVRQGKKMQSELVKKMKIVIVGGDVLKISFDNWNSVCEVKGGRLRCLLCQVDFACDDLGEHVGGEGHLRSLERGVKAEYLVHLLRQINDNTLHCMICNAEVSDKEHIILEHIDGKRHRSTMDHIRTESSHTNAYNDCETDVLQL